MTSSTESYRPWLAMPLIAAVVCLARPAHACPSCASALAARVEIFGDAFFFRNLALVLLPFVLIAALCVRVQNLGRRA